MQNSRSLFPIPYQNEYKVKVENTKKYTSPDFVHTYSLLGPVSISTDQAVWGFLNRRSYTIHVSDQRWLKGAKMKLDKESLKKVFPNLAEELQKDENKVQVNSVRTSQEHGEKVAASQSYDCYTPDVIDFIRRCDTKEQAEEIIDYMKKRGEIDQEYADKLRKQLKEKGVGSFGPKKEHDYYLKHGKQ